MEENRAKQNPKIEGNRDFPTAPSPATTPPPPWLELPSAVMTTILQKLGAEEILMSAELVCTTWRRLCLEPSMWRVIDIERDDVEVDSRTTEFLKDICRLAVDRSQGQLIDLSIDDFASNDLLKYIADRSPQLKRFQLAYGNNTFVSGVGLSEAVKKFPLLEELHLYYTSITKETIETIGRSCPMLKSFKLKNRGRRVSYNDYDVEAIAIAENIPELRHLQLLAINMTDKGLEAILNGCAHLESLDLRQCLRINLEGDLWKRCSQQIKDLRNPIEPTSELDKLNGVEPNTYYPPLEFSDLDLIWGANDLFSDFL